MSNTGLMFLLSMALLINACTSLLVSSPSGGQGTSTSASSSDTRITNQVNSALVREPGISSLDVYVRTYQGVVTLRGSVKSQAMKNRAVAITSSVAGVKSVRNQLRVR